MWHTAGPEKFGNQFFIQFFTKRWVRKTSAGGKIQWKWATSNQNTLMLHTDLCLAYEFGDSQEEIEEPANKCCSGCSQTFNGDTTGAWRPGGICPFAANRAADWVRFFAEDQQCFLHSFQAVWAKVTELGHNNLHLPEESPIVFAWQVMLTNEYTPAMDAPIAAAFAANVADCTAGAHCEFTMTHDP
eukprot:393138_1